MEDRRVRREAGFGLVELMVSAGLLVTIAVGVSQVLAIAVRVSFAARVRTVTTVLAAQKMEQLRSLAFGHARIGTPPVSVPSADVSTDLSTDPPADGGPGLLPSASGTLSSNVQFYADYLDAAGRWVGRGTRVPAGAVYIRRWSVQPLAGDPENVLVLQVLVTTASGDESRLVSLKTRRP